jgi:hypothetical protein
MKRPQFPPFPHADVVRARAQVMVGKMKHDKHIRENLNPVMEDYLQLGIEIGIAACSSEHLVEYEKVHKNAS